MKYLPLKFHVLYITFTLLFSFFGPKVYDNYNKPIVFVFILAYLLVITAGYRIGVNGSLKAYRDVELSEYRILKFFKLCLKLTIIFYLANIIFLYINGRLNLQVSQIGENYANYYDYYYEKSSRSIFTFELLFLVLSSIPKYVSLVLGFYYFDKVSTFYKGLFIGFLLMIFMTQTLSIGNQKSIGDVVIFGAIALVIKAKDMDAVKRKRLIQKVLLIVVMLFLFFSFTQYSRLSSQGVSAFNINSHVASYSHFDLEHPLFSVLGYKIGLGISAFVSGYLSGGYYGLSMSLQLPFEWTYGIGNSASLSVLAEKLFNTDIYSSTYLYRMELAHNIPGKRHWHTIFPWLASDFTWVGTLVIFFFISYFYGKSWKEVIVFNNPISILLFSLLSILFVFVPANNQILHGYDYLLITAFIIFIWRLKHIKYNVKLE
jgi:hypothetical protein